MTAWPVHPPSACLTGLQAGKRLTSVLVSSWGLNEEGNAMKRLNPICLMILAVICMEPSSFGSITLNIAQGFNFLSTPLDDDMGNQPINLIPAPPEGTVVFVLNA